jgi:glutathione peroxidase
VIYDFKLNRIDGHAQSLGDFQGKVLLLVNVASKCGLTPQYEGLEKLYQAYHGKGFEVLGFPANQFMGQEPGTNAEIQQFCTLNYGVKFPMFEKIVVKGEGQAPLYHYLTEQSPFPGEIAWNFEKFLVNRKGEVVARFAPPVTPDAPEVKSAIEAALAQH